MKKKKKKSQIKEVKIPFKVETESEQVKRFEELKEYGKKREKELDVVVKKRERGY